MLSTRHSLHVLDDDKVPAGPVTPIGSRVRETLGVAPRAPRAPLTLAPVTAETCLTPEFRRDWDALIEASGNLYAQYQSPEWLDHIRHTDGTDLLPPLTVRDADGELVGVVPLSNGHYDLAFTVREHILWRSRVPAVYILGSQPLLPPDAAVHDRLFGAIAESAGPTTGIYLHSVPTDTFCWRYLRESAWIKRNFLMHLPAGVRPFHVLELPPTFEGFLSKFRAKKKYNLARQVRLLREHVGGDLRLQRIEQPEQVPAFTAAVREVLQRSWQGRMMLPEIFQGMGHAGVFEDVARRGLLRSYVLYGANAPCALVLGYQFDDVFHYAEIAYDQTFGRFSPGTALLYLLIEDLTAHRSPRLVNFGIGDAGYKREFSNVHAEDASVLLLPKTTANAVRSGCHTAFRSLVTSVKRGLEARHQKSS